MGSRKRADGRLLGGVWLPLTLTFLAFLLRTGGLLAQSLWRDEVDALMFATRPLNELLAMFRDPGQNGPLFFLTLRPWLAVAGRSEFALRFPAALAGTLAVPVNYGLIRRLAGHQAALLAALLMAIGPYLIWYGQDAKMYAALTVLVPASLWAALEAAQRGGWRRWLLLYALTGISFYVHLLAALVVPVQLAWLLLAPGAGPRRRWLRATCYLAALVLPYLPLARWEIPMWLANPATGFAQVPLAQILLTSAGAFSLGVTPGRMPIELLPHMLALAGSLVLGTLWRPPAMPGATIGARRSAIMLAAWMLLPPLGIWAVSLGVPVFNERYLIWSMPALLAFLAAGVLALGRAWRPLGLATLAGIVSLSLAGAATQMAQPLKSDFRAAARFVLAHRQPGDLMVYQIPYIRATFAYYSSGVGDPRDTTMPWLDGLYTNANMSEAEAADRMAQGVRGHPAAWLIASEAALWDQRGLTESWLAQHGARTHSAELARVAVTRFDLFPP